jgi:hypothetical protein
MSDATARDRVAVQPREGRAGPAQSSAVSVAVRKGVHWIARREPTGHSFALPELPEPVAAAAQGLAASAGAPGWVVPCCRQAANVLLAGPRADAVAEAVSASGAREKIVRCAGRDDMLRVARVLALFGDYVVQDEEAAVIFPPWF